MLRDELATAKKECEAGNSAVQNAINRYAGLLPEERRQKFQDFLKELQPASMGGTRGNGIINDLAAELQTLIDSTPDGE